MDYSLSLTRHAAETLRTHLLGDREREQMAITLCGVNRLHHEVRLLVRDVILLPSDAFRQQTAARLELDPAVQAFVHQRAYQQGLIQVDWHSHPGGDDYLAFSATDDHYETAQALYLARRMRGVPYGSVVVNDQALDARLWVTQTGRRAVGDGAKVLTVRGKPQAHPMRAIYAGDLQRQVPASVQRGRRAAGDQSEGISAVFDRQVLAFGAAFQHKVAALRVGLVGLGGLGSALADYLARLGVRDWVLVDPDVVELTNLNRLVNATHTDAQKGRPKVYVARSTVRQANPKATVRALQTDVFDREALRLLKSCDLLVVATDNHSSRLVVNRLAVQYLIPVVHAGFNIGLDDGQRIVDVSGEFAIPDLGRWCLQCAGIVDAQQAAWELAPEAQREILRQRGYVAGTPTPAVRHLDGLTAALAAAEIHNLVHAFKPGHRYLVYDALRTEFVPLQVTPSDGCPVCSPEQGVLGLGDLEPMPDYRRASQVALPPPPPRAPDRCLPGPSGAGQAVPQDEAGPSRDDGARTAAPAGRDEAFQLATPSPDGSSSNGRARFHRLQAALDEFDDDPEWS
jgi:molybdopterin/thiamine biosynthesis adenylyltransferase